MEGMRKNKLFKMISVIASQGILAYFCPSIIPQLSIIDTRQVRSLRHCTNFQCFTPHILTCVLSKII